MTKEQTHFLFQKVTGLVAKAYATKKEAEKIGAPKEVIDELHLILKRTEALAYSIEDTEISRKEIARNYKQYDLSSTL